VKSSKFRRIGVLTGGGDCPGLNAVIRAVVKTCAFEYGIDVVGIEDGYGGLINDRMRPLGSDDVSGILARGGTILGSSNKDNPFRVPVEEDGQKKFRDLSDQAIKNAARHGLELLVVIGGDGSLSIAHQLSEKGLPVVGIPKTIDNDLAATDVTFGYDSALVTATDAVDKLHTTAASHHRLMVLEVMGRYAGWIGLGAGMSGGGDVILIPEIPFEIDKVAAFVRERGFRGRNFAIVVVAEGATPVGGGLFVDRKIDDSTDAIRLGGIGRWVATQLEQKLEREEREARVTVLGHLQRGGQPSAYDRVLATRFGVAASRLVAAGEVGRMVSLHGIEVDSVPLEEAVKQIRRVDPNSQIVQAARAVGTCFGD
jgi:phosphofructokinase-like protein